VRRDEESETAAQHPPPTTVSPCSQGGSGANGPVTPPRRRAPSTHSHVYEPLLVGWIVGTDENATAIGEGNGDDQGDDREDETTGTPKQRARQNDGDDEEAPGTFCTYHFFFRSYFVRTKEHINCDPNYSNSVDKL
jgi:hypothetical protein